MSPRPSTISEELAIEIRLSKTKSECTRWAVRGSRLFNILLDLIKRWVKILRVALQRAKAAPLQGLGICTSVPRSQTFEDEDDYELRDLDLPSLINRIRDSLDHLHVLQAFTETGLG
ncbi:MAG: hypothetical protein JO077_06020 [Verrucomicrobia bacterium]|nr:hypothetical protein [Verrucomicrobiota bacterium]